MKIPMIATVLVGAVAVGVCGVSSALAQLPPAPAGVEVTTIHGIEFSTIGNAGNAPYRSTEFAGRPNYQPVSFFDGRGTVDEVYRISRTEITSSQWIEFAAAIDPFWEGGRNDVKYTGQWTYHNGERYVTDPGRENDPVWGVSWMAAAAFCNWMTNGRRSDADAFRTGAYDLRGINLANPALGTPIITQNANAEFRLPTADEWHKATYFNPNRDGPGQAGWQRYSLEGDRAQVWGFVEDGGETYAGAAGWPINRPRPVAAYTNIQTPWGLFDTSGGVGEYTSDLVVLSEDGSQYYWRIGTTYAEGFPPWIGEQPGLSLFATDINTGFGIRNGGVRLVWTIPGPSSAAAVGGLVALIGPRTRRSR